MATEHGAFEWIKVPDPLHPGLSIKKWVRDSWARRKITSMQTELSKLHYTAETITYNSTTFTFKRSGNVIACNCASSAKVSFPTSWTTIGTLSSYDTFQFLSIVSVNGTPLVLRCLSDGTVQAICSTTAQFYAQGSGAATAR